MYIWGMDFVIALSADTSVHKAAQQSAGIMLTEKLNAFLSKIL